MRPDALISWGARRALRALALVATLFLGGALHELHHALEPHDGGSHASAGHACGCSTMHAAALVAEAQDVPSPATAPAPRHDHAPLATPAAAQLALAAPRAPPVA